jgi:hypothetical protein
MEGSIEIIEIAELIELIERITKMLNKNKSILK